MHKIILPNLGEGIESAVVAAWFCKVGDLIAKGDDILEVVTDKAVFNVSSECDGTLVEILAAEGSSVSFKDPLGLIQPS